MEGILLILEDSNAFLFKEMPLFPYKIVFYLKDINATSSIMKNLYIFLFIFFTCTKLRNNLSPALPTSFFETDKMCIVRAL